MRLKAIKAAYKAALDDSSHQQADQQGQQRAYPQSQHHFPNSGPVPQQYPQQFQQPYGTYTQPNVSYPPPPSRHLSPPSASSILARPTSPSLPPRASASPGQPTPYRSPSPLPPYYTGYGPAHEGAVVPYAGSPPQSTQLQTRSPAQSLSRHSPGLPVASPSSSALLGTSFGSSQTTQPLAPQSVPEAGDPPTVRKILCLDGGGIRGLSEVLLLQELMGRVSAERGFPEGTTIEPWQEFDMICGTSTGGLLAIMLGRLRMSLVQCRAAYLDMSKKIFTPARKSVNVAGKSWDFLQANGRFRSQPLIDTVQELLAVRGMSREELLRDSNVDSQACLTFVCATSSYGQPTCMRSYRNPSAPRDELLNICKVWEAARATSAASTFFDPIEIGELRQQFIDGAFIDNNPIEVADRESRDMFPGADRLIVSLGTGVGVRREMTGNLAKLAESVLKLVTATDLRNERFYEAHRDMAREQKLFRFSVSRGLDEIGLAEHESVQAIGEHTLAYTHEVLVGESFNQCAKALKAGGQRLYVIAGEELAEHMMRLQVSHVQGARCDHCHNGIPFNSELFMCFKCPSTICKACRGAHDYEHAAVIATFELLRWQKILKPHKESERCGRCLEQCRARISCKACEWACCHTCFVEDPWRDELYKAHVAKYPHHREYVNINSPYVRVDAPKDKHCNCESGRYPAIHCDRCCAVATLNEPVYWCRTCRLEYRQAQVLCKACWDVEEPEHLQQHHFQLVTWKYVDGLPDDEATQVRTAWRCADCNGVLPLLALEHHPHQNIGMFTGSARLETHRQWVIQRCPLKVKLDQGRPQPKNPVSGVTCNFCKHGVDWGEQLGVCMTPSCFQVFCGLCMQTNRHRHRHETVHHMRYQKMEYKFDINHKINCDSCGTNSMRGLFSGIECAECQNRHFCLACIQKAIAGTSAMRPSGIHMCRGKSWIFHRH